MTLCHFATTEAPFTIPKIFRVNRWNIRKRFSFRIGSNEAVSCTKHTSERSEKGLLQKRLPMMLIGRKTLSTSRACSRIIRLNLTSRSACPRIGPFLLARALSRHLSSWKLICNWSKTRSYRRARRKRKGLMTLNLSNHCWIKRQFLFLIGTGIKRSQKWFLWSIATA